MREVLADRHPAEDGVEAALARDVGDAVVGRVDAAADDRVAPVGVADDLALGRDPATQRLEERVPPCPSSPARPMSSPALTSRSIGRAVRPELQPADAQHRRAAPLGDRREPVALVLAERLGSGHQPHELLGRPVAAIELGHGHAGAHHRDPVADLLDLVHAVRDEDHADAPARELADDREQAVARRDVERGGRLVEDQDLAGRARARGRSRTPGDRESESSSTAMSRSTVAAEQLARASASRARPSRARDARRARCRRRRARRCRAPSATRRRGPPGRP